MRKIIFSKRSKTQLEDLLDYLEYEFSFLTKSKFVDNFDRVVYIIQNDPETFVISELNKNFRKCVISKQTTLYYKFNSKEIRLLSLFDTRQNPNKIKKIK
jgi:plasmid stabilization system protein ParE